MGIIVIFSSDKVMEEVFDRYLTAEQWQCSLFPYFVNVFSNKQLHNEF